MQQAKLDFAQSLDELDPLTVKRQTKKETNNYVQSSNFLFLLHVTAPFISNKTILCCCQSFTYWLLN